MKAIIKKGAKGFYFNLIGKNGENVGSSGTERYTQKAKCIQTLNEYFPLFTIEDKTLKNASK